MPANAPQPPRHTPDVLPDSVSDKTQPDSLPDDLRRRDQPDMTPDSLPRVDENLPLNSATSPDGARADHPIHDDDLEDLKPEDYERRIAAVEQEVVHEHPEGSAPPLDRLTQDREPDTEGP